MDAITCGAVMRCDFGVITCKLICQIHIATNIKHNRIVVRANIPNCSAGAILAIACTDCTEHGMNAKHVRYTRTEYRSCCRGGSAFCGRGHKVFACAQPGERLF